MTLAGAGGGARLGGSALGWVYLLLVRSHLGHFLPLGGGCQLLWHPRPHLVGARGGGCSQLTLHPANPTDTSSRQQVFHSGSRQHVHRFANSFFFFIWNGCERFCASPIMQTAFSSLFGCLLVFLFLRVRSMQWFGEWL